MVHLHFYGNLIPLDRENYGKLVLKLIFNNASSNHQRPVNLGSSLPCLAEKKIFVL